MACTPGCMAMYSRAAVACSLMLARALSQSASETPAMRWSKAINWCAALSPAAMASGVGLGSWEMAHTAL